MVAPGAVPPGNGSCQRESRHENRLLSPAGQGTLSWQRTCCLPSASWSRSSSSAASSRLGGPPIPGPQRTGPAPPPRGAAPTPQHPSPVPGGAPHRAARPGRQGRPLLSAPAPAGAAAPAPPRSPAGRLTLAPRTAGADGATAGRMGPRAIASAGVVPIVVSFRAACAYPTSPPIARHDKWTPPTPSSRCAPLAPWSMTRAASTPRRTTRAKRCSFSPSWLPCAVRTIGLNSRRGERPARRGGRHFSSGLTVSRRLRRADVSCAGYTLRVCLRRACPG
jgi:hypothetical protein